MPDDKPKILYESVLRSIEGMTLRRIAQDLEPKYPFLWKWDRTRYSDNYLVQRVSEEQVQGAIIASLEFFRVDVIAIDAGMKRARGRMIQAAGARGMDVSNIVNFKSGGLPAGFSDLHGTLAPEGIALYIEVKAPAWIDPDNPSRIISEAGKPTTEQLVFLDSKHSRGAICLVAWSVDDVTRVLGDRTDRNRAALDRRG
jgi:hypothetical protein